MAVQNNIKVKPSHPSRGLKRQKVYGWHPPLVSSGGTLFLAYSPFWIVLCLGIIVPLQLYEQFKELEYFILGLIVTLPCFLLPIFFRGKEDKLRPWYECFWVKANIWIGIFGYVGNYFWTHYFYTVLGATYTFPSWKLNHVPLVTYFLTHAYFLFYHMVSNLTLRRLRKLLNRIQSPTVKFIIQGLWVFLLGYLTALTEAITISNFPYYSIVNRPVFYKVGSLFYAIYFFVSFPMFIRVDEEPSKPWTLSQTVVDSLGAAMLVTIILDLWRLFLGPIVEIPNAATYKDCLLYGLPWLA